MRHLLVLLSGLLLLLGTGASCLTPPPHGYRQGALYLTPAQSHLDHVNCPRRDCERWFKTHVTEEGELEVDVRAARTGGALPQYSVEFLNERQETIAREASLGEANVRFGRAVSASTYFVGLISSGNSPAFDFELAFRFAPTPPQAPPEPAPEFETHTSQVLEAVGYGRGTVAVLIESGARQGMRLGFQGRLIDHGNEIGTLVIEQVYPDGSRARIQGTLIAPVTHSTIAEIDVPVGLLVEDDEGDERPFEEPAGEPSGSEQDWEAP